MISTSAAHRLLESRVVASFLCGKQKLAPQFLYVLPRYCRCIGRTPIPQAHTGRRVSCASSSVLLPGTLRVLDRTLPECTGVWWVSDSVL